MQLNMKIPGNFHPLCLWPFGIMSGSGEIVENALTFPGLCPAENALPCDSAVLPVPGKAELHRGIPSASADEDRFSFFLRFGSEEYQHLNGGRAGAREMNNPKNKRIYQEQFLIACS